MCVPPRPCHESVSLPFWAEDVRPRDVLVASSRIGIGPTKLQVLHASCHSFSFTSFTPFLLSVPYSPSLSLSPKFHWTLGSPHCCQEPGKSFKRIAKPPDPGSKFRVNQGCGSGFPTTAPHQRRGDPRVCCEYGNAKVPGAANGNAAAGGEAGQRALRPGSRQATGVPSAFRRSPDGSTADSDKGSAPRTFPSLGKLVLGWKMIKQ